MALSGSMGLLFFLIANFSDIFLGLNMIAGIIQISINVFVFIVWMYGFLHSKGFRRFVAFWGVIIPFIMTTITLVHVIIPYLTTSS